MTEVPSRPAGVPEGAVWLDDRQRWELGARDEAGARNGAHAVYRADGSLYLRCTFENDVEQGAFEAYHPNGQLARRGRYVDGQLDDVVDSFASDEPTTERLRGCCVPPGAWQMRARWSKGDLHGETFLDREGRVLLSNGELRPERPPGVPEAAGFDEYDRRWILAVERTDDHARWNYFTQDGRLDEETLYTKGVRTSQRKFAADGSVRFEASFDENDRPHGAWKRRFLAAGESPYANPSVSEERGAYEHGHAVGEWQLRQEGRAAPVRVLARGAAFNPADVDTSEVFTNVRRSAEAWGAMASELFETGRVREALCAAARAAGVSGDAAPLRAWLARVTEPLSAPEVERVADSAVAADEADAGKRLALLLSALLGGGDPATLLRAIASTVPSAPHATRDLVEAAIVLAPDRPMTFLTRALALIELGQPEAARADADRVEPISPDTAAFLRSYVDVLFPHWRFAPADSPPPTFEGGDMPDEPAQPLDRVRAMIATYGARLMRVRDALRVRVGDDVPAWLPPDLSHLFVDGEPELQCRTAVITDETDDGPETVELVIDERLPVDRASVPALLKVARADYAALSWLCWSVGADNIALPDHITPAPAFGAAVGQTLHRYFRARDVLETSGLRSLSAGVAGFEWEGQDIDVAERPLVEIAVAELSELRAMFLWLACADNLSPFQSDLRG